MPSGKGPLSGSPPKDTQGLWWRGWAPGGGLPDAGVKDAVPSLPQSQSAPITPRRPCTRWTWTSTTGEQPLRLARGQCVLPGSAPPVPVLFTALPGIFSLTTVKQACFLRKMGRGRFHCLRDLCFALALPPTWGYVSACYGRAPVAPRASVSIPKNKGVLYRTERLAQPRNSGPDSSLSAVLTQMPPPCCLFTAKGSRGQGCPRCSPVSLVLGHGAVALVGVAECGRRSAACVSVRSVGRSLLVRPWSGVSGCGDPEGRPAGGVPLRRLCVCGARPCGHVHPSDTGCGSLVPGAGVGKEARTHRKLTRRGAPASRLCFGNTHLKATGGE